MVPEQIRHCFLTTFVDFLVLFSPKYDGFYSAGLEVIVYPTKMRSIQVRASAGLDLGARLMKQDWRTKRGLEIEIGIGLHY